MNRDTDAVLAAIDGALADEEFPDGMRWSPTPETVEQDPRLLAFDGSIVPQPPQRYEAVGPGLPGFRGGLVPDAEAARQRWAAVTRPRGLTPDLVILDDTPIARVLAVEEDAAGLRITGQLEQGGIPVAPVAWAWPSAVAAAEELERAREQLARVFADTAQALAPLFEAIGRVAQETGVGWAAMIDRWRLDYEARQVGKAPPPPPALRQQDPAAYALQARQARGTGPARLVQHQHRPRRHQ